MFKHRYIEEVENLSKSVSVKTESTGRVYTFGEKKYPSITTVLGRKPNPGLHEWRKRVGEKEATRIGNQAAVHGTKFHNLMESYIRNESIPDNLTPNLQCAFSGMKRVLDENVDETLGIETPLYSDYLCVAGRCDLIAMWNGVPSIVDFKTSKRYKTRAQIHSYFTQAAAYALMFEEITTISVPQLIILMTVEGSEKPLVFYERRRHWTPELIDLLQTYGDKL